MPLNDFSAVLFPAKAGKLIGAVGLLIACTIMSAATNAQQSTNTSNHEGLYQVEMIVFARKGDSNQEHWPSNITLRYPGNWVELKSAEEGDTTKDQFYILPANERMLNAQAQKLQRSGRAEVLFHNAWHQVITNKNNAKAVIINGGQTFGQHQSLEGSIRLSVATYLELQTNLWFSQFEINNGQEITRQWPQIPLAPNRVAAATNILSADSELELERALANDKAQRLESSAATDGGAFITRNIILLQQERDMRSSEIHYIDHPVVGIIIQVTPQPRATAPAASAQ
jgi:hypothetical protein